MGKRQQNRAVSPGAMTARRFFRNRLAVAGLGILTGMFLFSFLGGALSPYGQDQVFYRQEQRPKEYAAVTENQTYRITAVPEQTIDAVLSARLALALAKGQTDLTWQDTRYLLEQEGSDLYRIHSNGILLGLAHKDLVWGVSEEDFVLLHSCLAARATGQTQFFAGQQQYTLTPDGGIYAHGQEIGFISRLIVQSKTGEQIPRQLRERISAAVEAREQTFSWQERSFLVEHDPLNGLWTVRERSQTRVWDSYAAPSPQHLLGTDKNGMDVLTRLMYGGRVSLVIGFIVVLISAALGVVLGGTAGYFGGWTDNLLMRLVDIFYCIPSTPILIILGAAMDALRVDPQVRMLLLMLILGILGWPGIARLVRGQILSLREQEFMTAAEALGLRTSLRIFRHLIPNVIPQLIVTCTMSLGSTILTEATLSFLGLGVKFPFASWGNIMNDVGNVHVLTSYWFVWIPAGVCLVLSVLGFNFVGDGLRDAFDPKMKR